MCPSEITYDSRAVENITSKIGILEFHQDTGDHNERISTTCGPSFGREYCALGKRLYPPSALQKATLMPPVDSHSTYANETVFPSSGSRPIFTSTSQFMRTDTDTVEFAVLQVRRLLNPPFPPGLSIGGV
ncbi:unnamed protein product [Protopolystoma xenopodis]|uniref:Uncharacterized protein n=1 Tax=Protopolystoma xenopodis TaxID=117903 RepID=A0A3S5AM62_9PLAT|nr:unnamed protein product [Protopolystoma xenopodis]